MLFERVLPRGTIQVSRTAGNYEFNELFEIAERKNPKRAFLFVSKVLGKHIPVSPKTMRAVYQKLSAQFSADLKGPVLFVGMAETAVGLGAGIYSEASKCLDESLFMISTRHVMEGELLCEFKESHSHAMDHLIYWPADQKLRAIAERAETLVLIDDEITTGNTFKNLLTALVGDQKLANIQKVITVTLTDWNNGVIHFNDSYVRSYALMKGQWQWTQNLRSEPPHMPYVDVTSKGCVDIIGPQTWGRLGVAQLSHQITYDSAVKKGEKILVLGTCEFLWQPFLLAERLEKSGAEVLFSSTTRSPIAEGFAIESVLAFSDNYGQGIPNYVYNVAHQSFDRILLCVETSKNSVDPRLIESLESVAQHVDVIIYE